MRLALWAGIGVAAVGGPALCVFGGCEAAGLVAAGVGTVEAAVTVVGWATAGGVAGAAGSVWGQGLAQMSGGGNGSDGQPDCLEGETDYPVRDPMDPGRTVTDIDRIEDGVLWEEKSAANPQDSTGWIQKHIVDKFNRYLEARSYLVGYHDAPIGFDFTSTSMDPNFKGLIEQAIRHLQAENPEVNIVTRFTP